MLSTKADCESIFEDTELVRGSVNIIYDVYGTQTHRSTRQPYLDAEVIPSFVHISITVPLNTSKAANNIVIPVGNNHGLAVQQSLLVMAILAVNVPMLVFEIFHLHNKTIMFSGGFKYDHATSG